MLQMFLASSVLNAGLFHDFFSALTAAGDSLGRAAAQDFFWGNQLFAKQRWEQIMLWLRLTLTLTGAILLIYEVRARRMGEYVSDRTKKRVAIAYTIIAFFTYFDFFNPNVRYSEYYHRHEFYHYYLGSKYSNEVGYTRLYECTMVAEAELGRKSYVANREIRDLRVNLIKPVKDTYILTDPDQCKQHFSPENWEAFKQDVDWFYNSARGNYWENMQKDHGYNPPPVWTMAGKFFASFAPAGDQFFKILAGLDVLFQAGCVVLLGWAFGWRIMAIATVFWGCNAPANFYWTGGAFMRQDWIFFLVASVCLARKRMFALSGAALTWSALLRVFPLILFAGPGIIIGFHFIKQWRKRAALRASSNRRKQARGESMKLLQLLHPTHRRYLAGCIVATGVLIPASMLVTSPEAYKSFVEHISVHKNTPLTNHMGLETILTHTWEGRMRFTKDENLDDPFAKWKQGRIDRKESLKYVQLGINLSLLLWLAWALRRTKLLWVGPALSVPLVVGLTNLTCYYYSMFMIAAVLAKQRPPLGPALLVASGASSLLLWGYSGFYYWDDRFTAQAYLFFLLGLLLLYSYSRPFSVARLKAWWEGKPEGFAEEEPKGELRPRTH